MKTKITKHLLDKQKINLIKVGNVETEINYSENQKTIDECMLNILKQKIEK